MTQDARVLCRRCGFANTPGDQFCGSCGAFLEWEGQPDAGGAPAAPATGAAPAGSTAPVPGGEDLAGLVRAAPPTGAAPPTAAAPAWPAASTPTAPASASPDAAGVVRCPACGIANVAGRTFCQSCGATLATASRVSTRSAESIAAAVAAVPKVAPVAPAPVTAAGGRGTASGTAPRSGGFARWLIVLVVLGIVVGVGVVVVPSLLKGSGPSTAATAAPSVASSAGAAASGPASSGASQTAGPSPSPAVAGSPLKLTGAAASTVLGGQAKYAATNVIDGDPKTSWQEGSATEKGQWIEVSFAASRVDAIVIRNGYGASTALFKGNLRLKDVLISVGGGTPVAIRLKDTPSAQRIDLGGVPGATTVRVTIVSTYPSIKTTVKGTPFQDAAVSEIQVVGVAGG